MLPTFFLEAKKKSVEVDVPVTIAEEGETKAPEPAPAPAAPVAAKPVAAVAAAAVPGTFTYAQLKGNPCEVQGDINPKSKEDYLSDAEFQEVFKMDRAAFNAQAGWKRKKAKVSAGLF